MTLEEIILNTLNLAGGQIRANMQSYGINASGRTSASIRVRRYAGGYQLIGGGNGTAPLGTVEIGRRAGKVPFNFAEILKEWADAKGLDIDPWAVAMSIKKKGTKRHKDPSTRKDVYSTVSKNTVKSLKEQIRVSILAEIKHQIKSNFEQK